MGQSPFSQAVAEWYYSNWSDGVTNWWNDYERHAETREPTEKLFSSLSLYLLVVTIYAT